MMDSNESNVELSTIDSRFFPPKRDGMRSSVDFKNEFGVDASKIKEWYKECYRRNIKFYLKTDVDHQHPINLVQLVRSKKHIEPSLALDEHSEALKVFVKKFPKLQRLLQNKERNKNISLKRDGMRSSQDFYKEFGILPLTVKKRFEECYRKGIKFYLKTDANHQYPLELVQLVKSKNRSEPYLALDEHSEALETFMEMFLEPELQRLLIPIKREGMRSSVDFKNEFWVQVPKVKDWYKECYKKNIKFYLKTDVSHQHPLDLVQWVKPPKGRLCLALHDATEALAVFKEWVKDRYGIELKQRTTSKTLRPRLKAGSTQGKPKAPPVRKPTTPEI